MHPAFILYWVTQPLRIYGLTFPLLSLYSLTYLLIRRFHFLRSTRSASFPVYLSFPLFFAILSSLIPSISLFDPSLVDRLSNVCSSFRRRERHVFYPVSIALSAPFAKFDIFLYYSLYYAYLPYLLTSWANCPPLLSYAYYHCSLLYSLLFLKLVSWRLLILQSSPPGL